MDFAKKQLEKYGWTEGQGLGKSNDGITNPVKPKLKFDNSGIGLDQGKELVTNWWNDVYKSALDNIEVQKHHNGDVHLELKGDESVDITTKGYVKMLKKKNVHLEYGSFVKTSKLTEDGTVSYDVPDFEQASKSEVKILTDEELFAACSGRTAHKGARHGLNLSGKLERLAKQEKMLLKKLQNVSIGEEKAGIKKKMKKLVKHKEKVSTAAEDSFNFMNVDEESKSSGSSSSRKKNKKKKKKRKSVSFNETVTVTEYLPPDLDSSVHSTDSNANSVVFSDDLNRNNDQNLNDEDFTIEQDIDLEGVESRSCEEEPQSSSLVQEKLSKAEHRLKKKKNRATQRFLKELEQETLDEEVTVSPPVADSTILCAKRKLTDGGDAMEIKRVCESSSTTSKDKVRKAKVKKGTPTRRSSVNWITRSLNKVCYISDDS